MTRNVGGIDRALRIVGGLVLVVLTARGVIGPFGWLGLLLLASGVFGVCGFYRLIGVNTCPVKPGQGGPSAPTT